MIVARRLEEVVFDRASIVTVGTFDGVHLGHQAIIRELVARAESSSARSVVVTFDPHPKEIVGTSPVHVLAAPDERVAKFRELGVGMTFVITFTYEFSRLTSREFFEQYMVRGVGVSEIIVGHDHMFGRDREAGFAELQKMGASAGFTARAVEPVTVGGKIVSSTAVRRMLVRGDVGEAARFLGREYSVRGTVVRGDGRGKSLGIPTANIAPEFASKLIPANGVYAVRVGMPGAERFGMLNIGVRPTFGPKDERTLEVNIFDFDGDLYGSTLELRFLHRLRDEQKFASVEALVGQLQKDRSDALALIAAQSTLPASS